ncbi:MULTISPECIES: hypothetical protein [Bacillaceae]|uniref:hypothetical protein n=1 Tax=Bacillaceae TaxID=186817 RepID=UPI001BDF61DA|nr:MULTISPECIES: hypothetical protein [Bacillaceae]MDX8362909.1 hypothetical protein [Cytobacillus sp. IB215316]
MNKKNENPEHIQTETHLDPSEEPRLVIKTNLDPETSVEENPYYNENVKDVEEFTEYFDKT